jgi:hypothetical protein
MSVQHRAESHRRPCVPAPTKSIAQFAAVAASRLHRCLTAIVPSRAVHAPLRVTITKSMREKQPASHRSLKTCCSAAVSASCHCHCHCRAMDDIDHVPRACRSSIMPLFHIFVSQVDPCCLGSTQHVSCIAVTALRDHCHLRARCACSPAGSCITRAAHAVSLAPLPIFCFDYRRRESIPINADPSSCPPPHPGRRPKPYPWRRLQRPASCSAASGSQCTLSLASADSRRP